MSTPRAIVLPLLVLICCAASPLLGQSTQVIAPELATSLEPIVELEQGWNSLPSGSRVRCWWWWVNGNVTKEAITRDLEEMKAKGYGGANVIDAGTTSSDRGHAPVPHGPDFGSPEWRELFVHALAEADRLGLELGFNIQSGWNLGGPTVTPQQAAKALTWSETKIEGGREVSQELPQPKQEGDYFRDVQVVAIPLPAADKSLAKIDNFEQKAYHKYPGRNTAIDATHLIDDGEAKSDTVAVAADDVIVLTEQVTDGQLRWDAPAGKWLVLRFGYTLSGAKVSTSSDNWKGWAIDYLDPATFDQYCDDVLTPILEAAEPYVGRSLRFLHTDSWELGPVNWTPAMPVQFSELRGYDLTPYLPALAGYVVDGQQQSNQFLNDFRRTLGDLIADGKYRRFAEYAHARGMGIHPESGGPHAAPVDALKCLGRSDIMMGEFWARSRTHRVADYQRLFVKQPSSAAHIYGRRLVMAEAFTTIGPHWEKDPRDLKPVFDRVACEGLNMVMWHTFDCSPLEDGKPGNAYFAGTHLNPQVTWWDQAEGFLGYLNRCQFLLQQGLPVSDVLYFYGENVPSFVRLKRGNPADVPTGYDYDVTNLEALLERTRVEDGRVVLPDGTSYAVLALPSSGHYGLNALKHVAELATEGARVVGEKPSQPYGLIQDKASLREFHALADRLWNDGLVRDVPVGEALEEMDLGPDFDYAGPDGEETKLDYVHRRTQDAEIYFIANSKPTPTSVTCSLRSSGKRPELWNPVDGTIEPVSSFRQAAGRIELPLELPANGSVFVVFRTPIGEDVQGDAVSRVVTEEVASELAGAWSVKFDRELGGPSRLVEFDKLVSWTESDDPRVKYYSGTAGYATEFEWQRSDSRGDRVYLDLGEVQNMARVRLNGEDLGVVWTTPFRVDLTDALRQGSNELQVEVVNVWANRLIGDAQLPRDQRVTQTNIRKFKGNERLRPSGLLGPVQILVQSETEELAALPTEAEARP